MECFLVPQRDLGCFCAGAVAPKPALFWGTHPTPLKTEISTLSTKLQTFYTINFFFLIAPRDLHYYWASAQPCADRLRRWQHLFCLWECPQNGVSSLRIAHIALFFVLLHKRNFFRMVPEGLNSFGSFVACSWERQLAFIASGKAKNGVFFHLIDKIADFLHNKRFFLIAPRDLHYY